MLGTGMLDASTMPLRSRIRPRLAGSARVRAKRTSPCFWKNSFSITWMYTARPTSPAKDKAMAATMNLLRHTGVGLASKGLEV